MSDRPTNGALPSTIGELAKEVREHFEALKRSVAELYEEQVRVGVRLDKIEERVGVITAKQVLDRQDIDKLESVLPAPAD